MSDKKLVIKVKYGASEHRGKESSLPLQREYAWNYRRIALVFGAALVASGLLAYLFLKDFGDRETNAAIPVEMPKTAEKGSQQTVMSDSIRRLPSADHKNDVDETPVRVERERRSTEGEKAPRVAKAIEPTDRSKKNRSSVEPVLDATEITPSAIVRAHFAWGIKDREPTRAIASPAFLQPGDSVPLYFFSEVRGLKGKSVSHVWRRNGKIREVRSFEVGDDSWQGYSNAQLRSDALGKWSVAIRLGEGQVLGVYEMEVLEPGRSWN